MCGDRWVCLRPTEIDHEPASQISPPHHLAAIQPAVRDPGVASCCGFLAPPPLPQKLPIAPIFIADKVLLAVSRQKDGKLRINYPRDDVKVAQLDEVLELRASSQRLEGRIYPLPGGGALTPLKN